MNFASNLINWYNENKRALPWRNTKDPYQIWLSEVILQQTRVEQGLTYYNRFLERFPSINELADANEDEVLKLWQGLGYYSRARNLHHSAKYIKRNYHGVFPKKHSDMLQLQGIGTYTAAAIASFAYNQPFAVVDGNVYRFLSRVFGIETPIDTTKGKKEFAILANKKIDRKLPGLYNQAIMEFGAVQCVPHKPSCHNCCFSSICMAFSENRVKLLPVKSKRVKQRNRFFNYLVIKINDSVFLNKRSGNDIWKNLYEFPLIETEEAVSETKLTESKSWKTLFNRTRYTINKVSNANRHVLSHQKIYTKFWEIEITNDAQLKNFIKIDQNDLIKFPVPKLIENYLQKSNF